MLLAAVLTTNLAAQSTPPVKLVVLVAVDQMRADYLARFASQWTGGFARIYNNGTVFEHGQQDQPRSHTSPRSRTSGRSTPAAR